MATVSYLAKKSLQRILVQGSEAPFEPDEYADYLDALNDYMKQLEAQGIDLGFTTVVSMNDEVTVPPGALRGIIANMAIEVSADYGVVVSDALVIAARQGLQTMRLLGQSVPLSANPSTLPVGSGNYAHNANPFYPGTPAVSGDSGVQVILTENN